MALQRIGQTKILTALRRRWSQQPLQSLNNLADDSLNYAAGSLLLPSEQPLRRSVSSEAS